MNSLESVRMQFMKVTVLRMQFRPLRGQGSCCLWGRGVFWVILEWNFGVLPHICCIMEIEISTVTLRSLGETWLYQKTALYCGRGTQQKRAFSLHAYLTNKNPFNCSLNVSFLLCFSLSESAVYLCTFFQAWLGNVLLRKSTTLTQLS